jgi:hypothetical protein
MYRRTHQGSLSRRQPRRWKKLLLLLQTNIQLLLRQL